MKQKLLILLMLFIGLKTFGQTSTVNKQKYWDYRDRLKKWFINVSADRGGSQPMQTRGMSRFDGRDYTTGGNHFPHKTSWMNWGDNVTMHIGYYIATLAMEYKLLKKNGQDTKATLKEICYALNALNRLDDRSDA
ncbi:MAG: hypothetical protein SGJ10_14665 [Bacteroidota bacterium]|nr:hypothetical protein [Bacteroidota bacterium]